MMLQIKEKSFYLNDNKINLYSGAVHYFRVPKEYWEDRLKKLKACGFNTVETYVSWNLHEPKKGQFNFEGMLDIEAFLQTAKKVGLYAIVRPGPYICAEWDFGGFPAWLLKDKNMRLRCMYPDYLKHVKDFYNELLKRINHMQITKGGNVIAMQIENEYGSFGNDKDYLRYLKDLMADCGVDVLMFTSDGNQDSMISGGTLPEVYKTLNFGSRARSSFNYLKGIQDDAPKMCMEFWCGWFDHWGGKHHTRGAASVVSELKEFLDMDASFNMYMFHGGTNFGFTAGANQYLKYAPTVTSYDYSAPLNEHGGYTQTYHAIRDLLHKHQNLPKGELPKEIPVQSIGKVNLTKSVSLLDSLDKIGDYHRVANPETMEHFGQNFGMIYYKTEFKGKYGMTKLFLDDLHDYAYVYVDGKLKAYMSRNDKAKRSLLFGKGHVEKNSLMLMGLSDGAKIEILVDTNGRVNYGKEMYDRKGISGARLGFQSLFVWDVYCLPLDNLQKLQFNDGINSTKPVFLKGVFKADKKDDCFINMDGFTKGVVYVNGINLGRYWNIGPQKSLYLPGVWLKEENEIIILELEGFKNNYVTI